MIRGKKAKLTVSWDTCQMARQLSHCHLIPLDKVDPVITFRGIPLHVNNNGLDFWNVLGNGIIQRTEPVFNQQHEHGEQLGGAANAEDGVLVHLVHANGGVDIGCRVGEREQRVRTTGVKDLQGQRISRKVPSRDGSLESSPDALQRSLDGRVICETCGSRPAGPHEGTEVEGMCKSRAEHQQQLVQGEGSHAAAGHPLYGGLEQGEDDYSLRRLAVFKGNVSK